MIPLLYPRGSPVRPALQYEKFLDESVTLATLRNRFPLKLMLFLPKKPPHNPS